MCIIVDIMSTIQMTKEYEESIVGSRTCQRTQGGNDYELKRIH